MFSFLQTILAVFITGIFLIMSASVFAEYDSKQKAEMNKESEELSQSNKEFTVDKQAETLGTHKVQEKLHDREVDKDRTTKSELPKNEDRSGKTIEKKREIHSDGPRADSDENTAAETPQSIPGK